MPEISTREDMLAKWLQFKKEWYEDETTHCWFRNFDGGWRIAVTPDREDPTQYSWSVFNYSTKAGDQRAPFTTRLAAARNALAHILVWDGVVAPELAQDWLRDMSAQEKAQMKKDEIVN